MKEWANLPSQKEVDRYANWGLLGVVAMVVAAGVPIGLSKLVPGLPFAAAMAIFGVLMIPVFVCYGVAFRHMVRSLKLRKAEQRDGRIVYTNRVGAFIDQHPYVVGSVLIGGALIGALIWTLLEPN
jgi:hypothetical protein